MRFVLENILLFLLPTVIYCGYRYLQAEGRRRAGQILNEAPLVVLFVAGAFLLAATRIYYGMQSTSGRPDQQYIPPHMGKDGQIVPGEFK